MAETRYCNVAIPHARLDELTYSYDPAQLPGLAPGDCVRVRLRGRKASAVVTALVEESPVLRTMPVEQVLEPGLVSPELLVLVRWVKSYYFGRMGEVLGRALPTGICGYGLRKVETAAAVAREAAGVELLASLTRVFEPPRFGVWVSASPDNRSALAVEFCRQARQRGSVLVLAPEVMLAALAERVRTSLGVEPMLVRGDLGHARRKRTWRELRTAERRVVLGIRSAVFAPVPDPAGIFVFDEHDKVFKEERYPRYSARDVAVYRARRAGCPVLFSDPTPSTETWHNLDAGSYSWLEPLPPPAAGPDTFVVDMRRHRGEVLSPVLVRELQRAGSAGTAVLCLNRRGLSRYVACRECGTALTCPDCSVAMVLSGSGQLACRYCGRGGAAPEACPSCHGTEFKFSAPGIERVAQEVRRVLPAADVSLVETDTEAPPAKRGIIVGTRAVLGIDWPAPVALVAALSIDDDLFLPDFRSRERVFQTLAQLRRRAQEAGARFVAQTRRPEETSVRKALDAELAGFMAEELELRKSSGFPPFCRLALIVLEGRQPGPERHAAALARKLGRSRGVEVLGPAPNRRGAVQLLVKLPRSGRLDRLVTLAELEAKGVRVRVDVDPLEIG